MPLSHQHAEGSETRAKLASSININRTIPLYVFFGSLAAGIVVPIKIGNENL
jgi:hypothetical protein